MQSVNLRVLLIVLGALVALCGRAAPARAADKPRLPASVIESAAGGAVTLSEQASTGNWVLLYLQPDSPASARLVDAMRTWNLTGLDRLIVIVGGRRTAAAAFAAREPVLPGIHWLVDPERTAWTDLKLTGVPTVIGARDGVIEWRLAGVLNDPEVMRSVLVSWLQ